MVDAALPIMARQRHLQVRSIGHVGISPLALKRKHSKDGLIRHHLLHLQCDNSSSSDEFNILAQDNENCLRVIKKVF